MAQQNIDTTSSVKYIYEDNNALYKDVLVSNNYYLGISGIISSFLNYQKNPENQNEINNEESRFLNAIDIYWCNPFIKTNINESSESNIIPMNIFTTGDVLNYIKNSFKYNGFNNSLLISYVTNDVFNEGTDIYNKIKNLKDQINDIKNQINKIIDRKFAIINPSSTYEDHNGVTQYKELGRQKIDRDKTVGENSTYFYFISKQNNVLYDKLDITVSIVNKENNENNIYNFSFDNFDSNGRKNIIVDNKILFTIQKANYYTVKYDSNAVSGSLTMYDYNNKSVTIEIKQNDNINDATILYTRDFKKANPIIEMYAAIYDIYYNDGKNNYSIYKTNDNGEITSLNNNFYTLGSDNKTNNRIKLNPSKYIIMDNSKIMFKYYYYVHLNYGSNTYNFVLTGNNEDNSYNDYYIYYYDGNNYTNFINFIDTNINDLTESIGIDFQNLRNNNKIKLNQNIPANHFLTAEYECTVNTNSSKQNKNDEEIVDDYNYIEYVNSTNSRFYNEYKLRCNLFWFPDRKYGTLKLQPYEAVNVHSGWPCLHDQIYYNDSNMIFQRNWVLNTDTAYNDITNPCKLLFIINKDTHKPYTQLIGTQTVVFNNYNMYTNAPIIYYEVKMGRNTSFYAFVPTNVGSTGDDPTKYNYALVKIIATTNEEAKNKLFSNSDITGVSTNYYQNFKKLNKFIHGSSNNTFLLIADKNVISGSTINDPVDSVITHILYYFDKSEYYYTSVGKGINSIYADYSNGEWKEYTIQYTPVYNPYGDHYDLPGLSGYTLEDYQNLIINIITKDNLAIINGGSNVTQAVKNNSNYYTNNVKYYLCPDKTPVTKVLENKYYNNRLFWMWFTTK